MAGKTITIESRSGEPLQRGDTSITPVARSLRLQLGDHLGLIWNRPSAILVESGGSRRVLPVVDVTRLAQWAIWGLALGIVLMAWMGTRRTAKRTPQGE